ncbi:hypothetical protein N9K75_03055 [bacterium]|nr:hypothetical protein [bacterium]
MRTGTFDNNVGSIVTMNRRDCNEDPNQTCSAGLHVAAYEYAHTFGSGELVLCEVDPRDVVAVPKDYNQKKMRTCSYKVVGLADKPIEEATYGDDPYDIEERDEVIMGGEGFSVVKEFSDDYGVLVTLRSLENGQIAYTDYDITNKHFTFR